jgi:16S rRNA (adenine1518-N6/adenine1519-N6)-dimethyltransferase
VISAKEIFDKYGCGTTKKLGQNFLFDENINRKIVAAAGDLSDKIIAEIGPGPGGLTLEIVKHNIRKLYLIEYDRRWAEVWRELRFALEIEEKLEIIGCDALKFDMKTISPNIIISNLPYNISTQLLFRWLPEFDFYEKLVLTFQKEVADRLYASPCTKSYGKLSVLSQWKSKVSKVFDIEPGSFSPAPKVRSSVVQFQPFQCDPQTRRKFQLFSDILTAAFAHRRKIVVKHFEKYFSNPIEILEKFGYDKNTRAEQISVDDYVAICDICADNSDLGM